MKSKKLKQETCTIMHLSMLSRWGEGVGGGEAGHRRGI